VTAANKAINNNPLYNPSQTLSGTSLKNAADSIATAQTAGPISALAQQIAQNNKQASGAQNQTFGYFMQLAKAAQAAVGQQAAGSGALNAQQQQLASNTQTQLGQLGQQAQGGTLGRMNAQGLGGDSVGQLGAVTAQQQGTAASNAQNYQAAALNQGASGTSQAVNNAGAYALGGQEKIGAIGRAGQLANVPLNSKIATLQASQGTLAATALGQLRTQERNYGIAQAGLGIKQQTVQNTATNNATRNALTATGQQVTMRGQNMTAATAASAQALTASGQQITAARDAANAAYHQATVNGKYGVGGGSGAKPLSASLNAKAQSQLSTAIGVIHQGQSYSDKLLPNGLPNPNSKYPNGYSEAFIKAGLGQHYHIPDYLIAAAYQLVGYGSIDAKTASYLHNVVGMRGGTYNGAPIKVTANYVPPTSPSGAGVH
jgi:hypothetical protein